MLRPFPPATSRIFFLFFFPNAGLRDGNRMVGCLLS